MRYETAEAAILQALRKRLRSEGWTSLKIAAEFKVGVATVKRWMTGKGMTLQRLDRLARLCRVTIAELARDADQVSSGLPRELTLAQERALSKDIVLSLLFSTLLAGIPPEEIAADFRIPPEVFDRALDRLERLALIDRLSGGRVRCLIDQTAVFLKSPMRELFEEYMKPYFMSLNFTDTNTLYTSEVVKISQVGAAKMAELIEKFRYDVLALSLEDRRSALLSRKWYTTMCVMCELDTSLADQFTQVQA